MEDEKRKGSESGWLRCYVLTELPIHVFADPCESSKCERENENSID